MYYFESSSPRSRHPAVREHEHRSSLVSAQSTARAAQLLPATQGTWVRGNPGCASPAGRTLAGSAVRRPHPPRPWGGRKRCRGGCKAPSSSVGRRFNPHRRTPIAYYHSGTIPQWCHYWRKWRKHLKRRLHHSSVETFFFFHQPSRPTSMMISFYLLLLFPNNNDRIPQPQRRRSIIKNTCCHRHHH